MDYLKYKSYLMHYGVEGQKWGVRRYQNADGTLTDEGRVHYGISSSREEFFERAGVKDRGVGNNKKYTKKEKARLARQAISEKDRSYAQAGNDLSEDAFNYAKDSYTKRTGRVLNDNDSTYALDFAESKEYKDYVKQVQDYVTETKSGEKYADKALQDIANSTYEADYWVDYGNKQATKDLVKATVAVLGTTTLLAGGYLLAKNPEIAERAYDGVVDAKDRIKARRANRAYEKEYRNATSGNGWREVN